jgi:hypothetical protein
MATSLPNVLIAEDVNALYAKATQGSDTRPEFMPAISQEQAKGIIHAVLWLSVTRPGDFAAAYAHEALAVAVGKDLAEWITSHLKFISDS